MSPVSAKTRLAGVIGWPLDHTLSPVMHNAAYAAMDIDWVYLPLPVPDVDALMCVVEAARYLRFVGFNVTMPYKEGMLDLCDETAMFAQLAGAVNTVHCVDGKLMGYNTDGRGLLTSLRTECNYEPKGSHVVILGAGGAAGAALVAFILADAASVTIVNRSMDRADVLLGRVEGRTRATRIDAIEPDVAEAVIAEADLIVNATPLGMQDGQPSPIPEAWLSSHHVVADMVYRREATPLLAAATAVGATTVGGLGMLVEQGATAIEIWGASPDMKAPRDIMRAAAEDALSAGKGA